MRGFLFCFVFCKISWSHGILFLTYCSSVQSHAEFWRKIGSANPSSAWIFCLVCLYQGHCLCFRTFFLLPPLTAWACRLLTDEHSTRHFQIIPWDYSRKDPRWKERWCETSLNCCLTSFRFLVIDSRSWTHLLPYDNDGHHRTPGPKLSPWLVFRPFKLSTINICHFTNEQIKT